MNIQKEFDNFMLKHRHDEMKTSNQLALRELILIVSNLKDKSLPIKFKGTEFSPTDCDSWRGSYSELCVNYEAEKSISTESFLEILKSCIGKTFGGYKGGEYLMGNNTPVWVANYGCSNGYTGNTMGIIGIEETESENLILAEDIEY